VSKKPEDYTRTWRYKTGIFLIVFGHLCLLLGVVLPFINISLGALAGVLIVCGELTIWSSVIFLGKAGFVAIRKKMFRWFKKPYIAKVGPVRHYIGIALLLTNFLTTYILALYAWHSFSAPTPETPFPTVWYLDYSGQGWLVFSLFLIGQVSFLTSFYVLGANWWVRFRDLIIWKAPDL